MIGKMTVWLLFAVCVVAQVGFGAEAQEFDSHSLSILRDDPRLEVISYDDDDSLDMFLVLPNQFQDHSFNVRFTPTEAPFQILGFQINLFDLYADQGNPGLRASITRSNNGHPGPQIVSFDVPNEELSFSGDDLVWTEIQLSNYNIEPIAFDQLSDFHIVVNVIQNNNTDTLAVFFDNGDFNPTDRSGIWSGSDREWVHLFDLYEFGYNFTIRAIVSYGEEENRPPVVRAPIADLIIGANSGTTIIADLDDVFVDPDHDQLTFSIFGTPELNLEIDQQHILTTTPGPDFSGSNLGIRIVCTDPDNASVSNSFIITVNPVGVPDLELSSPENFALVSVFPNPFNDQTRINYYLPGALPVLIGIFDLAGNQVAQLVSETQPQGYHTQVWNPAQHPNGVYIIGINAGRNSATQKVLLLK